MLWIGIFLVSIIIFILGIVFLVSRLNKIKLIKKRNSKFIFPFIILCIFILILFIFFSFTNIIVIILHYFIFWLVFDGIFYLIKKIRKKDFRYYYSGLLVLIFVPIYLSFGWYNAHHIYKIEYNIKTNKDISNLHIAVFSDSHLGTTFDSKEFGKSLKEMEKENVDMILIAGDFVDDGTSIEEMQKACKYLGNIKTKYGIYFSYGNHDKGYYGSVRGFSKDDLEANLRKNNINVLEDDITLINDEVYIIGRSDAENINRKSIKDLTNGLDQKKYMIILDHQPTDYENEKNANVDLVLSGHTHGGQLIPINYLNKALSDNYRVYGYEKRNNTNYIVSSGISDWEIKFKTGCISEYLIIDIKK